jgi:hypothetical protein
MFNADTDTDTDADAVVCVNESFTSLPSRIQLCTYTYCILNVHCILYILYTLLSI